MVIDSCGESPHNLAKGENNQEQSVRREILRAPNIQVSTLEDRP